MRTKMNVWQRKTRNSQSPCAITTQCVLDSERYSDTPPQNVHAGVSEGAEAQGCGEMFGFGTGQGLGQHVGLHLFCGAEL